MQNSILSTIHSKLVREVNNDDTKSIAAHANRLVETIYHTMHRIEPLFGHLSPVIDWAGSYYDGTVVSTELNFDVKFALRLPTQSLEVITEGLEPGTARLRIPDFFVNCSHSDQMQLAKWLGETGCLKQDEVRLWVESAVENTILHLKSMGAEIGKCTQVKKSDSALVIEVTYFTGVTYSVNIVVAIILPEVKLSHSIKLASRPRGDWMIIPKPRGATPKGDTFWRTCFSAQEKALFYGKLHLIPTLQLLKKLRDNQGWHKLTSYQIKTLFLWQANEQNPSFWGFDLSYIFLHMLKKLYACLCERCISYFWDSRVNLLRLTPEEIAPIREQLKICIEDFDREMYLEPANIFFRYLL